MGLSLRNERLIVILLLTVFAITALSASSKIGHSADAAVNLGRGINIVKTGKFYMSQTHTPLTNTITGLPFIFLNDLVIPEGDFPSPSEFGYTFLYFNSYKPETIIFLARVPLIILATILGLVIYRWAKELFGVRSALFALFLYILSPNILANAGLINDDIGVTFFLFVDMYFLYRFLVKRTLSNLLLVGLFTGFTLIAKTSGILVLPIIGLVLLFALFHDIKHRRKNKLEKRITLFKRAINKKIAYYVIILLITGFISLLIINLGFGFETSFQPIAKSLSDDPLIKKDNLDNFKASLYQKNYIPKKPVEYALQKIPLPLPYYYFKNFIAIKNLQKESLLDIKYHFMGKLRTENVWFYYPVLFLVKTPIPTLIFILLAIYYRKKYKPNFSRDTVFLTSIIFWFIFFAISQPMHQGLRYIIPIYPLIFVYISNVVNIKRKIVRFAIPILIVWYIISAIFIYPFYISYFNELAGGPKNGYKYSIDCDFDTGQNGNRIKNYMGAKGIEKIHWSYYGSYNPDYYGINYELLPSSGLATGGIDFRYPEDCKATGIIVINAFNLYRFGEYRGCYDWLHNHKPIDRIGYNIFVYNITKGNI